MWIAIAIVMILSWGAIFYLIKKQRNTDSSHEEGKVYTPKEILNGLSCEVTEAAKTKDVYLVDFQGGHFIFDFRSTDLLKIHYDDFMRFSFDNLHKALLESNNINLHYAAWTCHIEKRNAEQGDDNLTASLSTCLFLTGNLPQMQEHLRQILEIAFHVSREFYNSLNKRIEKSAESEASLLNDNAFQAKIARARILHELSHQEERKEEYPADNALSVGSLIKIYEDIDFGCLKEMRIICGTTVERLTDIHEIVGFNVREYIRSRKDAATIQNLILAFGFERQDLLVNLAKEKGSTESTLYFGVDVMRSENDTDASADDWESCHNHTRLEIRLADADKDYWEAKYMLDDANDKVQNGKTSELTDEQQIMLSHASPSVQMDLYWGKRFYNGGCHIQALYYFNRIFRSLTETATDWDKAHMELYYSVSCFIGFIYMDLNMPDRAFYYLFYSSQNQGSLNAIEEFANCLCEMNNPHTKTYIISALNKVVGQMNKSDEEYEYLQDTYLFLKRRLAYTMIERNEFDEAETFLNKMIEEDENVEFAKTELEYLREKRAEYGNNESDSL